MPTVKAIFRKALHVPIFIFWRRMMDLRCVDTVIAKRLKIKKETTHDLVRWRRVTTMA